MKTAARLAFTDLTFFLLTSHGETPRTRHLVDGWVAAIVVIAEAIAPVHNAILIFPIRGWLLKSPFRVFGVQVVDVVSPFLACLTAYCEGHEAAIASAVAATLLLYTWVRLVEALQVVFAVRGGSGHAEEDSNEDDASHMRS